MRLSLGVFFMIGILGQGFLIARAVAVGTYESPCHSQEDKFDDARKNLDTCIDRLEETESEKTSTLNCLAELKNVNDQAKQLRDCRNKTR